MAPLPRNAPRRRKSNAILSDNGEIDVSSGPEQHGVSQGEHAKSSSSSNDIVSSTKLTTSTTLTVSSLASGDVHTSSAPILKSPPTSTPPPSTTNTGSLSTFTSDAPSSPPHFVGKPVSTTSSSKPTTRVVTGTSTSSSSTLPPTETTEPSVASAHEHVVLPSLANVKDGAVNLTSNHIPSSTLSRMSLTTDVLLPTTTALSGGSLRPTKSQLDSSKVASPEETNKPSATRSLGRPAPTNSLFPQDDNPGTHSSILNAPSPQPSLTLVDPPRHSSNSNTTTTTSSSSSLGPILTQSSTSHLSLTSTRRLEQTPTSAPSLAHGGVTSSQDKSVKTAIPSSDGVLDVSTSDSKAPHITSVTTSLLSTTSVTSSPVLKATHSVVTTSHAASPSDEPVTTKASSGVLVNVSGSGSKASRTSSASVTTPVTSSPVFKPTDSVVIPHHSAIPSDEPVKTSTSSGGLLDASTSGSKTTSVTTSVLSTASVASPPVFKPTDSVATHNHAASPSDEPVKTSTSSGGLLDASTSGSKTTSVTTTSVASSPVFKPTDSVATPSHAASSSNEPVESNTPLSGGLLDVSSATSKAPKIASVTTPVLPSTSVTSSPVLQTTDNLKLVPSQLGSSVPLIHSSPTSSPVKGGRISKIPAPSSSLSTTSFVTDTITPVPVPSLTRVDGARPNPNQVALVDAPDTTNLSTSPAFSHGITSSFTTTTAIVSFSATQISGRPTSIPVTQTIQTVLPTVLPAPATSKKSVPVTAIVPSVSAAVILIVLLIGFMFNRRRQRARAVHTAFDFSSPDPDPELAPAPAMRQSEPVVQQPPIKEVTVLPPIPAIASNWGGLAARAFAPVEPMPAQDADPFADVDSTLEDEKNPPILTTRLDAEPLRHVRTVPSIVLPPMSTPTPMPRTPALDPFIDPPPALVSMFHDGGGPSRLSRGSAYDEPSIVRASMTSSHVGRAM